MPKRSLTILLAALLFALALRPAAAAVRIKDITDIEGVRDNQLIGYGLVVGLNGTGDKLNNAIFTRQSLIGMLGRLGVNTNSAAAQLSTKNVAAVMVTANLPAFARSGGRIDVAVSALGDASSLAGGTLLVTPLMAADGEVYAVAQGALITGSISAKAGGSSVTQGVPTAGQIPNGAIVERAVPFRLASEKHLYLALRNPDLNTAEQIAGVINARLGGAIARATDPRTVRINLAGRDVVASLAEIQMLTVNPQSAAVVVVDEATGTIVMGADVQISTVAIAQGNITVRVTAAPRVSQPRGAINNGTTAVTPGPQVRVSTGKGKRLAILPANVTLRSLVASLNALGVTPHDMISILENIKAAGALQARLVVR